MFDSKKTSLFSTSAKSASKSTFVDAAKKEAAITSSGNGAKKYSTTGSPFVDQFSFLGSYKEPRSFSDIEKDCEQLWAINKLMCVVFVLYIRTITRITSYFDGSKTEVSQSGAGLKHEAIMRMIWLHQKAPDTFWKNIPLFITVGSWRDIFEMLRYDLSYHNWDKRVLDWKKFGDLILSGLENPNISNLLKKYLPTIKANKKCTTVRSQANNIIGKWLTSLLFESKDYKSYRKLKTSGTAHEWQKLISQRKFERINFNSIHGRALNKLVRSKFLDNQNLREKYEKWIESQPTAKYTGFVVELFQSLPFKLSDLGKAERETINKQFLGLLEKVKDAESNTSLIVVRDTSASMGSNAAGISMPCYNIAKALALFFSYFLKGKFENAWIEFSSDAKMHTWKGNTPLERWYNDRSSYVGSTDFQSVIDLFCKLRSSIPESEFPTGILCVSDSEFNPSSLNQTNVETALARLRRAGFSNEYVNNFVIVLWNLQSSYYGASTGKKFETYGSTPNVFYFSGYEASVVRFLAGNIKTASDLFDAAMDQEVLRKVEL